MHIPCSGGGEELKDGTGLVFVLLLRSPRPSRGPRLGDLHGWKGLAITIITNPDTTDIVIWACDNRGKPRWHTSQEQPVAWSGTDKNLVSEHVESR